MTSGNLKEERDQCEWPVEEMTYLLHGGQMYTERKRRLRALLEKDPVFDHAGIWCVPRLTQYEMALKMSLRVEQLIYIHKLSKEESAELRALASDTSGCASPTMLQTSMVDGNLRMLFSEEQCRYWEPLMRRWEVIGCYAQVRSCKPCSNHD